MKCAYCGNETNRTKEHIISSNILDLFPECYITFDEKRKTLYQSDPRVNDVCSVCNNKRLSYIDNYAKKFISQYFVTKYTEDDVVEIEYDYVMVQKMLLKYAFNDLRAHKDDCTFFDDDILRYLLNEDDKLPKKNVTILCGLAVNVSPVPDAMFGNLKLRWSKDPILYSNSTVQNIDYETGNVYLNENVSKETFKDLKLSYIFRFHNAQFLLMCWDKSSINIEKNNLLLSCQYPYHLLNSKEEKTILPLCTDEINYHNFEHIHVKWDGLFEVGLMRKLASGGKYRYKEIIDEEWKKEEENIKKQHPRK